MRWIDPTDARVVVVIHTGAVATASVNGIEIYHEVHGAGPPLLTIGGTGGDLRQTPAAASPFAAHFTTLAFDQRGLGRTAHPDGTWTMADYAADAAGLVMALGWDRCHVVGTSFGGMVALELAIRHPELIDRLVLCCTSPGGALASYPLHELRDRDPAELVAIRMRLLEERWDPDADEPIPGLGAIYPWMERQALAPPEDPMAADGLRRQIDARAGHDVMDRLERIAAPTLVCAGRYDAMAPLHNARYLADHIPRADLAVFDGGHVFMLQDPTAHPTMIEFLLG